jgi:hypothetical protein
LFCALELVDAAKAKSKHASGVSFFIGFIVYANQLMPIFAG